MSLNEYKRLLEIIDAVDKGALENEHPELQSDFKFLLSFAKKHANDAGWS